MDREKQEEKRAERPRFRGELMERPSAGQTSVRGSSSQMAGRQTAAGSQRTQAGNGRPGAQAAGSNQRVSAGNGRLVAQTGRTGEENSRPRFRGESQYGGTYRSGSQQTQAGRAYQPEWPAQASPAQGQSQPSGRRTYQPERPVQGQSQPSGRRTYRPERPAGNGSPYSREARARTMARRRKKRRQQQMILTTAVLALFLLIGGTIFGMLHWQDSKERKEFAESGVAAAAEGNYEEAIAAFDNALKPGGRIGKFETDVLLNRAEAEYRQGLYDKALETYRLLEEDDKDNELAKEGIVLCLIELGSYDEALSMEILQSQVYNRIAVDRIEAGQYEEALSAIALGRGFPDTSAARDLSFNEAVVYEKTGDYAKALELFEAYAAQYGEDERAKRELAFLRTRQGNNGQ